MKIVNLTPHSFTLFSANQVEKGVLISRDDQQPLLVIPSSGTVRCRVNSTPVGAAEVEGIEIPLDRKVFGELEGLPDSSQDTMYIVSAIAASAAWKQGRSDVACPGDAVRAADGSGMVVGSLGLSMNPDA